MQEPYFCLKMKKIFLKFPSKLNVKKKVTMKYEIKLSVHTAQLLYVNAFFTKIRFPIPEFSVSHCT